MLDEADSWQKGQLAVHLLMTDKLGKKRRNKKRTMFSPISRSEFGTSRMALRDSNFML